jgi:hypothetical protein
MGGVWAPDPVEKGFLIGGQGATDQSVLAGNLVTFDTKNNNWKNETTSGGNSQRFQAQLVYVPGIGKDGILIVLGGLDSSYNTQMVGFHILLNFSFSGSLSELTSLESHSIP